MPKTPYLVQRGNMFWWRRRRPVLTRLQLPPALTGPARHSTTPVRGRPGISSLRTTCPKEAGRRAARMNLLFEEKRRSIEATMSGDDGMGDQQYLHCAKADMAATLPAQVEMLACQIGSTGPTVVAALPQE